ncbi:MAG: efflux transporter periplasmic adaptor subunit, partial [Parvibaculaceae bacterium]
AVFVVVDGVAEITPVKLGERRPGEVEILSGVEEGDTVLVSGQLKIQDGATVEIAGEAEGAEPAAEANAETAK